MSAYYLLTDPMMKPKHPLFRVLVAVCLIGFSGGAGAQTFSEMLTEWDPAWPQRTGLTVVGYSQEQNYALDNFTIDLPIEVDPTLLLSEIENEVSQWGTKADFWILPFLNVHAMVGVVDGQTGVALTPAAIELIGTDQSPSIMMALSMRVGQLWPMGKTGGFYQLPVFTPTPTSKGR